MFVVLVMTNSNMSVRNSFLFLFLFLFFIFCLLGDNGDGREEIFNISILLLP